MKKNTRYFLLFLFIVLSDFAWARQPGSIGLGVVLGTNCGPTVKYRMNKINALDVGIGFQEDMVFYADYLWQVGNLFPEVKKGTLGGYVGLGPRWEEKKKDDKLGIRAVFGLDYYLENHPIEIFFEVVPVFQLTPETDTDFDIGLGIRFYLP